MQPPPLFTPMYEFKGIIAQVWQRWFHALSEPRFYDRGDPITPDFTVADFTTDATWRDLSLASIVPAGAVAVVLKVILKDDAVGSQIAFRKNGNAYIYNTGELRTQAVDVVLTGDIYVFLDAGRIIEYYGSNLAFTGITVTVKGWWL